MNNFNRKWSMPFLQNATCSPAELLFSKHTPQMKELKDKVKLARKKLSAKRNIKIICNEMPELEKPAEKVLATERSQIDIHCMPVPTRLAPATEHTV